MRKTFMAAAALALLGMTGAAQAATANVTYGGFEWDGSGASALSLTGVVPSGNHPENAPCIICGINQPNQLPGFGYNDYKTGGNIDIISAFSTAAVPNTGTGITLANNTLGTGYEIGDGSLFKAFLLNNGDGSLEFSVGFDVNDTGEKHPQTLLSFYLLNLSQKTILAAYTGGETGNIPSQNNGQGFPDYSITGFNLDRDDIGVGDRIIFLANMTDLNDGPESFFINASPSAAIPLPAGIWMFGAALTGLGALKARSSRRQKKTFAVS